MLCLCPTSTFFVLFYEFLLCTLSPAVFLEQMVVYITPPMEQPAVQRRRKSACVQVCVSGWEQREVISWLWREQQTRADYDLMVSVGFFTSSLQLLLVGLQFLVSFVHTYTNVIFNLVKIDKVYNQNSCFRCVWVCLWQSGKYRRGNAKLLKNNPVSPLLLTSSCVILYEVQQQTKAFLNQ